MNYIYMITLFHVTIEFVQLTITSSRSITMCCFTIEFVPLTAFSLRSMFKYRKLSAELLERRCLSVSHDKSVLLAGLAAFILKGNSWDIDTEGSFMIERVAQMARSLLAYLRCKAKVLHSSCNYAVTAT